ncbi:glycerate kinase [Staphylococcus simiae]|uniref:glycerate kinase n=1 Tax=Staphylococcus simiae TaxID=308354 RepID=UPI001A96528D|nr:glycerate kinase [Staphylococcus simiae]MBO1198555.1 glycerate kinase [Staphylococcus simiae]MBO1202961.1 glycerate kinase [Staphylococcus simiae]MBO1210546.1 glycerate kinase [Staphylococcus simiae]QSY53681.1 glycerate kinase [Staphylococcus simiae]
MHINKVIIASDSFKESMTAQHIGQTIQKAFQQVLPDDIQYDIIPMADGGEGTTEALIDALNAQNYTVAVHDPLMRPVKASYARSDLHQTAIIEMAEASGLQLLHDNDKNPLHTTSFGTGELIKDALDHDVKTIILGLGGSATNDGGSGMLSALGIKFIDHTGHQLQMNGATLDQIDTIDCSHVDHRLQHVSFKVACDVNNPLLGPNGATAIYGPQKGASQKMIPKLDTAMRHYHDKIASYTGKVVKDIPGAGAAGGMGAATLAFFNTTLQKGIDVVFDITNFYDRINNADLVITGEGRIDHQTIFGKTPVGVAQAAKQFNIPVIAICGSLGDGYQSVYEHGIDSVFSIIPAPCELSKAISHSEQYLYDTATNIARLLNTNSKFKS